MTGARVQVPQQEEEKSHQRQRGEERQHYVRRGRHVVTMAVTVLVGVYQLVGG